MHKLFIYAETAFHHEGDMDFMLQLIDKTAEAGVDGIKFQVLINFDELISSSNPAYQKLQGYIFSYQQWKTIFDYSIQRQLAIVVMPLDTGSFQLTKEYKDYIRYIELHSVSYHDQLVKERIKELGIDLILGAGGRTKKEIDEAVEYFGEQLRVLMTGFQSYPSAIQDIRLRKIQDLRKEYPDVQVGYGDHSSYDDPWCVDSNTLAYAMGASVFEKHITLNEGQSRVDFESAIGVEKLKKIKENLDKLYDILFSYKDSFEMTPAEVNYRNRQKMAVANGNLKEGSIVTAKDISLKMVGRFDGYSKLDDLVGKRLVNAIQSDTIIRPEDVSN
ncbi:MAG TPA: N-acetylneuraminate synthase family protein [Ohtaekwangia sp.]|uniref:N-acetylneuraminate synthase family protein n=1 Tax=Ohtaekwangia sp. TaxID=2066019 RepID=UPI002F951396